MVETQQGLSLVSEELFLMDDDSPWFYRIEPHGEWEVWDNTVSWIEVYECVWGDVSCPVASWNIYDGFAPNKNYH